MRIQGRINFHERRGAWFNVSLGGSPALEVLKQLHLFGLTQFMVGALAGTGGRVMLGAAGAGDFLCRRCTPAYYRQKHDDDDPDTQ